VWWASTLPSLHQTRGVHLLDLVKKAEVQAKSSAYCNSSSTLFFYRHSS
jgi:hypothetical protein